MSRSSALMLGLAVVATCAGCSLVFPSSSHTNAGPVDAFVSMEPPTLRVAHLARDAGSVDIFVDDTLVADGIAFSSVGTYVEVGAGTIAVRVEVAGAGTVLVEQDLTTSLGRNYTLTFFGDALEPPFPERTLDVLLLEDETSGFDVETEIRLRVIHVASPVIAGNVVQVADGGGLTTLADDLGFGEQELLPALASARYTVGFDAGAEGFVDVAFDLPAQVPGTYANVFIAARDDDSVFLLVSNGRGGMLAIDPAPP